MGLKVNVSAIFMAVLLTLQTPTGQIHWGGASLHTPEKWVRFKYPKFISYSYMVRGGHFAAGASAKYARAERELKPARMYGLGSLALYEKADIGTSQDMDTCEDILPCVPLSVAKSVKSLYLGRMGASYVGYNIEQEQKLALKTTVLVESYTLPDGRGSGDWALNGNTLSLDEEMVIDVPEPYNHVSKYGSGEGGHFTLGAQKPAAGADLQLSEILKFGLDGSGLPRLSGLIEDEWITNDKFTRFTDVPLAAGGSGENKIRDEQPKHQPDVCGKNFNTNLFQLGHGSGAEEGRAHQAPSAAQLGPAPPAPAQLVQKAGASVPRIFVNGTFIGGAIDTHRLHKEGKLLPL